MHDEAGHRVIRLPLAGDPKVRALLAMTLDAAVRKARRLGLRRVRAELCRILRDGRLDDAEPGRILALLEWIGPGREIDALAAILEDADLAAPRREVARALLEVFARERAPKKDDVRRLLDHATLLFDFVLSQPQLYEFDPVYLFGDTEADVVAQAFDRLERHRRVGAVPALLIYGGALARAQLAPVHERLLQACLEEAGPATLALLERVAPTLSPEAARLATRARLLLRNGVAPRPPGPPDAPRGSGLGEVHAYVSPVDGSGDFLLQAEVQGDKAGAGTCAWLVMRLGGGVRHGSYRFEHPFEKFDLYESLESGHVEMRGLSLRDATRLALEATAQSDAGTLEHDARQAITVFKREAERCTYVAPPERRPWFVDEFVEPALPDDPHGAEAWRGFLEDRFHQSWELDDGDLAAAGLARPSNPPLRPREPTEAELRVEVPAFSREVHDFQQRLRLCAEVPGVWVRDALARLVGTPVPARLARMLRFTADRLTDNEKRPRRAEVYRREAARLEADVTTSGCARAVVERSALEALDTVRQGTRWTFLGGQDKRLILSFAVEEGRTRRHLALCDLAEAALLGIVETSRRTLFAEERPCEGELANVAAAIGLAAFDAPDSFTPERVRTLLEECPVISASAAVTVAGPVHAGVVRFVEAVCAGCPESCASRPTSSASRWLDTLSHPRADAERLWRRGTPRSSSS